MHHFRCTNSGIWRNTESFICLSLISYKLNQRCVQSFGKGLNVMEIHLYVKVPHSNRNVAIKTKGLFWSTRPEKNTAQTHGFGMLAS